jgi:hypothetical protein
VTPFIEPLEFTVATAELLEDHKPPILPLVVKVVDPFGQIV